MTKPVLDSQGFLITPRREALALWSLYREHPDVIGIDWEREGSCFVAEQVMLTAGGYDMDDMENMPVLEELNDVILECQPEDDSWPEPEDQTDEDRLEIMAEIGARVFGSGSDD